MKRSTLALILYVSLFSVSESAQAWGERGHDLVTRVAARLMAEDKEYGAMFGEAFIKKEHMLAHLANVPDIVWRSAGKDIEALNAPTHYLDVEYISLSPTIDSLPKTIAEAEAVMKKLCTEKPKGYECADDKGNDPKAALAGTAPFRIKQLASLMQASFQKAKEAQKIKSEESDKEINKALDDAFFYGGILSHFVGDLANPYHTTRDYNGYEIGQGGVHKYFETDIVNTFDLKFDGEVFVKATKLKDLARLKKILAGQKDGEQDPLLVAYAQTLESFASLKTLQQLDLKYAVTKKGSDQKGLKLKAERKEPHQVARQFRDIAGDRMAQGAATLAWIWRNAWIRGGKPDLRGYDSYDYRTTPEFVGIDY